MIFAEWPVHIVKVVRRAGFLAASLITVSACDIPITFPAGQGGSFDPCTGDESPPASFKLTSSSLTLRPGQSIDIGVDGRNAQGAQMSCVFPDWSTNNFEIASVSFGRVTGVKDGTTMVKATWSGFVDSVVVTVKTPVITGVWITLPSLLVGQTARANMIIESPDNIAGIPVVYSSKDTTKAIVSSKGMVTALTDGIVDIVAAVGGVSGSHRLTITRDAPQIKFSALAAGAQHTCGLVGGGIVAQGTAICWGSGWAGQLGNGRTDNSVTPVIVGGATISFKAITSGEAHTCALSTDGDAYCWGSNFAGETGDGTAAPQRSLPVKVASTVKFASISAGLGHTCALTSDTKVYCWGRIHETSSLVPVRVEGLPRITQLSSEKQMACALSDIGEAWCWGEGDGLVVKTSYSKPTKVGIGMTFKSIASGGHHTCGLKENGAVYCWGMNSTGQIDPMTTGAVAQPFLVSGGYSFNSIAAGGLVTCGITVSTGTRCMGQTMLGNAPGGRAPTMLEIPRESEHPFVSITSGQFHTCAIDNKGGAWCWGEQRFGAVGAGEGLVVDQPLQVRVDR